MSNRFSLLLSVVAVGLATLPLSPVFAESHEHQPSPSGMAADPVAAAPHKAMKGQSAAPAADPMALRKAQQAAKMVEAKLNAPPPDAMEMVRAVRGKNVDLAKRVLLRNGFTTDQLDGADIVLEDKTGGGQMGSESRFTITIEASCCPVKVVITIRL